MMEESAYLENRIEEQERIAKANQSSIRFLQLSLQLFFQWGYSSFAFLQPFGSFLTYKKQQHDMVLRQHWQTEDSDFYSRTVQPLCVYWTIYNLLLLVGIKCIDELGRTAHILTTAINYVIALFIVVLGFIEEETKDHASMQIYHRYAPFQVLNCLTVVSLFYFTRAREPRRFSTSPGNFVWVWLFLAWSWAKDISGYMWAIGLIYAFITLTSVGMLALELLKGMTTFVKKLFVIQFLFSLVLTALTEIFGIISHKIIAEIANKQVNEMIEDDIAVSLLQLFIIVNILDMIFWIFGRCVT